MSISFFVPLFARYYLEDVEQNSTDYIRDDKITAHQQVLDIVE